MNEIQVGDSVVPNPNAGTLPERFYEYQGVVLTISDDGERCDLMSFAARVPYTVHDVKTRYLMVQPRSHNPRANVETRAS
jgi:hypothetical protein